MLSVRSTLPAVMVMLLISGILGRALAGGESGEIRPAYFAGSWYPGDAKSLEGTVDELLAEVAAPEDGRKPMAVIAPHAGYRFSAPVSATAYRYLKGQSYRRVIALGFSHRLAHSYRGVDVPESLAAYQTPLGRIPIDTEACAQLGRHRLFQSQGGVDRQEHSIELQLPFLQRTIGTFKLVPLYLGQMSTEDYVLAAEALLPLVDDDTLIVVSSDFTHYGPNYGYEPFKEEVEEGLTSYAEASARPIEKADFDGFLAHLDKTHDTVCGRGPILLLLRVLSMRGGADGICTGRDMSGRMLNDFTNSVTYQSFVFVKRTHTLNKEERTLLLDLARRTAIAHLTRKPLPAVSAEKLPEGVKRAGACFVTYKNAGALRGCIGNMVASGPLYESVMHNAVNACEDHRFVSDPITASELQKRIDIEISYLTPMEPVSKIEEVIIGRHGLLITLRGYRGVLLPQVASERGWTREQFLMQVCRKAGLPADAWRDPAAELYKFEAEVFGEKE